MTLKPFYDRTEDVHVGAYVAYGHTDGKLYADAEHKMKVSAADLGRAFMLGRLIVCDGKNYFAPIAYAETTGVKTYDGTAAKSWSKPLRRFAPASLPRGATGEEGEVFQNGKIRLAQG